jgi:hypothetical protein
MSRLFDELRIARSTNATGFIARTAPIVVGPSFKP